jgi:hypothetical protein
LTITSQAASSVRACRSCGDTKPTSEFGIDNARKDRLNTRCKACVREAAKERRRKNAQQERTAANRRYRKNRDKLLESCKSYYQRNRDVILAKLRQETRDNPEKRRLYLAERRKIPSVRLNKRMSWSIQRHIRSGEKGGRRWPSLVGYTLADLRTHIESQFVDGMSWENYGDWHIDHIIPLSAHNYDTFESPDFKRAWALENLRPLWAADNLRKGAKLIREFQPSLSLT